MAIFRWDDFCERFAQAYVPISHEPSRDGRQRRFFRHNALDERMDISKQLTAANRCSLFMSVITAYDGDVSKSSDTATSYNFITWRRHVLFWARSAQASAALSPLDELAAADAKHRAVTAATDFIAFLGVRHEGRPDPLAKALGIDLGTVSIATLPVSFNGWWIASVSLDQLEPRPKCLPDGDFDDALLADLFADIMPSAPPRRPMRPAPEPDQEPEPNPETSEEPEPAGGGDDAPVEGGDGAAASDSTGQAGDYATAEALATAKTS